MSPYQKPIWDIPFPAITICTETKAKSSEFKFREVYQKLAPGKRPFNNITPDEYALHIIAPYFCGKWIFADFLIRLDIMQAMSQVCDPHLTTGFEFDQNTTSDIIFSKLRSVCHLHWPYALHRFSYKKYYTS